MDGQLEGTEDKRWTMPFVEIEAAIFSFQNIMKIDNLEGLVNLTKLQLDNNVIEKMIIPIKDELNVPPGLHIMLGVV